MRWHVEKGDVLGWNLSQTILLFWRARMTSRLRLDSKLIKVNIELDLFTTQSQCQSITHKRQYSKCSKKPQIIDTVEMNICISQTMVEFGPSGIFLNGTSLIKRSSVSKKATLLISLTGLSIQPWLLQLNHKTLAVRLIWTTIISNKG